MLYPGPRWLSIIACQRISGPQCPTVCQTWSLVIRLRADEIRGPFGAYRIIRCWTLRDSSKTWEKGGGFRAQTSCPLEGGEQGLRWCFWHWIQPEQTPRGIKRMAWRPEKGKQWTS